jgi:hypothetical protein
MQQPLFPDLKSDTLEPALTFRDENGVWIFARNHVDVLNRLWRLARYHTFNVCREEHVLMAYQGQRPDKMPKKFLPRFDVLRPKIMHMGLVARVTDVCKTCAHSGDCLGPEHTLPVLKKQGLRKDNISFLAEAIDCGGVSCPLFHRGEVEKLTIELRDLRAAGFEPVTSARAFTDRQDEDTACVSALAGVDLSDPEAVNLVMGRGWHAGVLSDSWRRERWNMVCSKFEDLFFDRDIVAANRLKARIRGLHAAKSRARYQAFRAANCSRCLYDCKRPHMRLVGDYTNFEWKMADDGPLTREWIMDNYADYDRDWMQMFTIMGHGGHFINPDTGRLNMGIGCWPNADGTVRVVSLRPDYSDIDRNLALDEYRRRVADEDHREQGMPVHTLVLDHEHMVHLNWALHALMSILKHRDVRFNVDGRSKRNDILFIRVHGDLIEVGSDTRATDTHGFQWHPPGFKPDRIDNCIRPRFRTHYHHPYADSILSWLGRTPGGC